MKRLYKFYWNCGRMGELEGLFIATEAGVKSIQGHEVYFGEVLGKHSEIYGTIDEGDITEVSSHPEVIKVLKAEIGETVSGYNPFHYWEPEDQEEKEGL